MGLFSPESKYVTLNINGKNQGLYLQYESWSSEFLAKNRKTDVANFYDGDANHRKFTGGSILFWRLASWEKIVSAPHSIVDDYAPIQKLLDILHAYPQDQWPIAVENLIDMDTYYRWHAHLTLAKSHHQSHHENLKWYFDPVQGRLQFIPWDLDFNTWKEHLIIKYLPDKNNFLNQRLLSHLPFLQGRNQILWDYVQNPENLNTELDFYDETWKTVRPDFYLGNDRVHDNPMMKTSLLPTFATLEDTVRQFRALIAKYYQDAITELQQSKIILNIQCPPSSRVLEDSYYSGQFLCRIILKPQESAISPALLKNISFTVSKPGNPPKGQIYIYFDQNYDKVINEGIDSVISQINYDGSQQNYVIDHFNQVTFSRPDQIAFTSDQQILMQSPPFVPKNGMAFNFFILTDVPGLRIKDVTLDLRNSTNNQPSEIDKRN